MIRRLNIEKLSKEDIKNLKLVKNGDVGFSSRVYRFNETECIKIFKEEKEYISILEAFRMNKFTSIKLECAEMPKRLAFIDKKYIGYILNFIDGVNLENCLDYDFSEMVELYSDFISFAAEETAKNHIYLVDTNAYNIMLDNNSKAFKLIDSDNWWLCRKFSKEELKTKNFKLLSQTFSCFALTELFCDLEVNDDFIEYYEKKKEGIERDNNVKIKTIRDIRNIKWYGNK